MLNRFSLLSLLFASTMVVAQSVDPTAIVPLAPAPSPAGDPAQASQSAQPGKVIKVKVGRPEKKRKDNAAAQQAVGSMMGNMIGGGGGPSDAVNYDPSGGGYEPGYTNGIALADQNAGQARGENLVSIDGCKGGAGKFKFVFGHVDSKTKVGCDTELKASEKLVNVLENHLARCVMKSMRPPIQNFIGGKIFHSGVKGDANHDERSLHTSFRAIDINAISVGGTILKYSDKSAQAQVFFSELRNCWGLAVEKEMGCGLGKTSAGYPGSIGHEDGDHQNHLHFSVPHCNPVETNTHMVRWWQHFLGADAFADTFASRPRKHITKEIEMKNGGLIRIFLKDTGGEPVSVAYNVSVDVRCRGEKAFSNVKKDIEICSFDDHKYFEKEALLKIAYSTSKMSGGLTACLDRHQEAIKIPRCK